MALTPYTADMRQEATYWPPEGNDGYGGVLLGAPVGLMCRWQDQAVLFRSAEGREETSSAVVYPDRRLAVGGYLALGDGTSVPDPRGQSGLDAREIRQAGQSPDLVGSQVLNKVWLG